MTRDVFKAIADPIRRDMIGLLSTKPYNINDLSGNFKMTRTGVSKHLKILRECGLVEIEQKGRERYCKAKLESLAEVSAWVNQYRSFWNEKLDNLENLLKG